MNEVVGSGPGRTGGSPVPADEAAAGSRPFIDVVDSTWFAVRPSVLAPIVAEPANWRRWWPGLELEVDELRGEQGVRWHVRSVAMAREAGVRGSAEVWLERAGEGVVAHVILRLDPAPGRTVSRQLADRVADEYRRRTKLAYWALGDQLDPGRFERHTSVPHLR